MLPFYWPPQLIPFLLWLVPHLHFSPLVFSLFLMQGAIPRLDLQDTKRESMVLVWKELQTSGEKSVTWNMKIKANRNFMSSSLSIFFPCTILGFKCVSRPNMGKKDWQFCGIISWYRGWTFCYQQGWSHISIFISFYVKRNIFVLAICDPHSLQNVEKLFKKSKSFIISCPRNKYC